jgi:hypothetical protein
MDPHFLDLGTSWRCGQLHAPATLPPGKEPLVPIGQEAGWAPEPVWTTWRRENSWPYRDSNSDPSVVQPICSHYTDCAIPIHQTYLVDTNIAETSVTELTMQYFRISFNQNIFFKILSARSTFSLPRKLETEAIQQWLKQNSFLVLMS